MTHTLHRKGRLENLEQDFVVFTMSAKTVNAKGSAEKMQKFFEILEKDKPLNYGDMKTGNRYNSERETIYNQIKNNSIVHFVYNDPDTVKKILEELKKADLGTSIIVSGVVDKTDQLCRQVGLKMHTVEFSGGIHGQLGLLPEEPVLEITTMCGHGMVAGNLVKEMAKQVKKGKKTLQEAAVELAKPCQCGIFNPKRAESLLEKFL
jgi:NAD-dependent SIR2 family protein deacetylase